MTVIVDDGSDWRMADVIWVDGGARNPKVPTLFQVADVDTGVINWVNADLVTHIVQVKRLNQMLPAIAVILWCNLLAVLANG